MMPEILSSMIVQVFWWTVPVLIVLGVVVIVHELGHFLTARAVGIKVKSFSVGLGSEIVGFTDKYDTRWKISWIPLGGFVSFKGDQNAASLPSADDLEKLTPEERAGNFHTAALWRRSLVLLAGPFANFLLGFAIFTGMVLWTGIIYQQAEIICVEPGTPAAQAGLKAGDKILAVGGQAVRSFEDFSSHVVLNARSPIDITVGAGKIHELAGSARA
jgi:regulator of sigma E protease